MGLNQKKSEKIEPNLLTQNDSHRLIAPCWPDSSVGRAKD